MGDLRFRAAHQRFVAEPAPSDSIAAYSDADLVRFLAADSKKPYHANVAASELLNRLQRKNAICDVARDGLCVLDENGCITHLNPAARRFLELPDARVPAGNLHELVHAHCRAHVGNAPCPLTLALRSQCSVEVGEDTFATRDGTLFRAHYTVTPIHHDRVVNGFLVVIRDGAHQRESVASMERSEARVEDALRMARVGRWDWDARNDGLAWDDTVHGIFGVAPEAFEGRLTSFLDRLPATDRERMGDEMAHACTDGRPFRLRHRVLRDDGFALAVETRGMFVFDGHREAISAWGTHQALGAAGCEEDAGS